MQYEELRCLEWHRQIKKGWEDVQKDPRIGQARTQGSDANRIQNTNLGVLRSKIRHETNGRRRLQEFVQRKGPELGPDILIPTIIMSVCMMCFKFPWLIPCNFWLSKIKKCHEGRKIWWQSWRPTQYDLTARYSGKWCLRLLLAVAPASHKVHSFKWEYLEGNSSH
jgi:hypothetical protein